MTTNTTTTKSKNGWTRRLAYIALVPILIILVACTLFYFLQLSFVLQPNVPTTDSPRTDQELKALRPPGHSYTLLPRDHKDTQSSLHCMLYRAFPSGDAQAKGLIAYLHGNRGNQYECRFQVDIFLKQGYDVAVLDYRSYGGSKGPITEEKLLDDALLWYDDLIDRGYNQENIIVWGRSFGTGLAAYIASRKTPAKLVLETPYYSLEETTRANSLVAWAMPSFLFRLRFPTYTYQPNTITEVHLIHGDADEKISYNSSQRLKDRWMANRPKDNPVKLWPITGGMHNLRPSASETSQEFTDAVQQILNAP